MRMGCTSCVGKIYSQSDLETYLQSTTKAKLIIRIPTIRCKQTLQKTEKET